MGKEGKNFRVGDGRMPPFCWQEKTALRLIRSSVKDSERATALALYVSLTELASNAHTDRFFTKRQSLGEMIGRTSVRSVDYYLDVLTKLRLIDKNPSLRNGEYTGMDIILLKSPSIVVQSTAPPLDTVQSTAPPPCNPQRDPRAIHDATSGNPLHISSEESSLQKNLSLEEENAGDPKTGLPQVKAKSPEASSSRVEGEVAAPAEQPEGRPSASDLHPKPIPPGGGIPGMNSSPAGRTGDVLHEEQVKRESKAKFKGLWHPDRPLELWGPRDAIGYFRHRFMEKFPGEGAPDFKIQKDIPALKHRFQWLREDGLTNGMMKQAIDHLFDKWDHGLKDRLKLDGSRPGLGIIESTRLLEMLVREIQGGTGGARKTADSYDPAKHDAFREDVKRTGDKWGGLGKKKA